MKNTIDVTEKVNRAVRKSMGFHKIAMCDITIQHAWNEDGGWWYFIEPIEEHRGPFKTRRDALLAAANDKALNV